MANALLGPDEIQGLGVRVERQPEAALVPVGHRLAELGQALGFRVAVVGRLPRARLQRVENGIRRRHVRIANAERDHVDSAGLLLGNGSRNADEKVRWQLLNTLCESHVSNLLLPAGRVLFNAARCGARQSGHMPEKTSTAGPSR